MFLIAQFVLKRQYIAIECSRSSCWKDLGHTCSMYNYVLISQLELVLLGLSIN